MALPRNRQAVAAILEELRPRIIGKVHGGFSCSCGEIHFGPATAVEIEPAGNTYPGQETMWYIWSVRMSEHPEDPSRRLGNWSCGLSEFVPVKELEGLFARHFGTQAAADDAGQNEYRLAVRGVDRCKAGLPEAVRIMENDTQIRFCFDWGREQLAAAAVDNLCHTSPRWILAGQAEYRDLVSTLSTLEPEVYRGGPDPELPAEPTWHLDYHQVLERAARTADHVFSQNLGTTYSGGRKYLTGGDVVFMKVPVN